MIIWATERKIRNEVAELPEKWFDSFKTNQPADIRKLGDANNATLLFRVEAVLEAVENGLYKRVRTIKEIVSDAVASSKTKENTE